MRPLGSKSLSRLAPVTRELRQSKPCLPTSLLAVAASSKSISAHRDGSSGAKKSVCSASGKSTGGANCARFDGSSLDGSSLCATRPYCTLCVMTCSGELAMVEGVVETTSVKSEASESLSTSLDFLYSWSKLTRHEAGKSAIGLS